MACNCEEEKAPETWSVDRSAPPTTSAPEDTREVKTPEATPEVVKGSALNGVFLADEYDGLKRVFITEKEGFSQADYNKGDETTFTISVTDLKDKPDLRTKYADVTDKVAAHPYMARGKGSMVLVDGRFQVKLTSKTLDETARRAHLEKIDFSKLPK
jgi:hypothetical protein